VSVSQEIVMPTRLRVSHLSLVAVSILSFALLRAAFAHADAPTAQTQRTPVVTLPSLAPLIDGVRPAVVNVEVTSRRPHSEEQQQEDLFGRFFGRGERRQPRQEILQGAGSGFVIDPRGHILTNNHVVQGAFEIRVRFNDGRTLYGEVLGTDPLTDVGLIKLKNPPSNLPVLPLGDSDAIKVGDWVVAIGNPFGLASSVSAGIISAKAREIGATQYDDFLQTDAAINPGNSGGPLFNLRGEVIGINTAIVSGGSGIGFAVPSNLAKEIVSQLEKNGKVTRGYVGATLQSLTPELAKALNVQATSGAIVNDVSPGSPGEKAGLKQDDIVVSIDGKKVESGAGLARTIALRPPGSTATLGLLRGGKPQDLKVTLGARPTEKAVVGQNAPSGSDDGKSTGKIGLSVQTVDPVTAKANGLPPKGAVITNVQPGSPADDAELIPGMVITEADGKKIGSSEDVSRVIKAAKPGSTVLLRLRIPGPVQNSRLAALTIPS
jgi:serine protease Do